MVELPNEYIVKALDELKKGQDRIEDKLDRKVGRGELFGWLGATATLIGIFVSVTGG